MTAVMAVHTELLLITLIHVAHRLYVFLGFS